MTPNQITCSRALLGIICAIILMYAHSVWSYLFFAIIFIVAAITDLLDGYLARKMNMESNFGRIADPIADKVLNLSSFFALSYRGVFSIWWLIPIVIREVLVTYIRVMKVSQGKILPAEFAGKLKTVVQYVTIGISFLSLLLAQYVANNSALALMNVAVVLMMAISVMLTIYSGFMFLRKNL